MQRSVEILQKEYRDNPETSRSSLGISQPPIQWVPGVKLPGAVVGHPPPFNVNVKNDRSYTSTPLQ